ncbi:uncharacterized protein BJX67DRAFT_245824 [Aspergillus lucknowensis]|uniref:Uncharacterized protein n=1 Tax=Aspergillus lucknowensis TaxID=176173 RepID=A0ABR4M2M2_9EURO
MPATIGWVQAFGLLSMLALNTMLQPVGRVLGSPENSRVWLRASPFICVLDALALIIRLLAYYIILDKAAFPRKALLILGTDRFDESDAETEPTSQKRKILAVISRLFTFVVSILPLLNIYDKWGETRWTVAWAWMYIASYAVLEIAMQLARRAASHTREAAAEFELGELAAEDGYDPHEDSTDTTDEADDDPPVDGKPEEAMHLLSRMPSAPNPSDEAEENGENVASSSVGPATGDNQPDPEAAKRVDSPDDDPAASARLSYLKKYLDHGDRGLLVVGYIIHTVFVSWTLLDLVQPLLQTTILTYGGFWEAARIFMGLPILVVALVAVAFGALLILALFLGLLAAVGYALMAGVKRVAPKALERTMKPITAFVSNYPLVAFPIAGVVGLSFIFTMLLLWSVPVRWFGFLISKYMIRAYLLIGVELVLLVLVGVACLLLRLFLEVAAESSTGLRKRLGVSRYLEDSGVGMLTGVLVTFLITILWYRFRYPSFEPGQLVDGWREYLEDDSNNTTTAT